VRARNSAGTRLTVLEVLIARRQCRYRGVSFVDWVGEHRAEIERGVEWYEAQNTDEGHRFAKDLRTVLGRPE